MKPFSLRSSLTPPWLKNYQRGFLKADLTAGALVAVMLVPQGMAYAMLAGLPPVYGLYASTLPIIAYAIFGSSRHLAVGPVAIVSLLIAASSSTIAEPGTTEYLQLVALLTVMVGLFQLILGVLRAGFMINFVSHAVVNGFVSGGAVIISLSQLRHLLGLPSESGHAAWQVAGRIAGQLSEINLPATVIGVGSAAAIVVLKKYRPHFPAGLLVVVAGTAMVYFFQLNQMGVAIVGTVPGGLPELTVPVIGLRAIGRLVPTAMIILFVGYMESIAVAQWVASRGKYRISPNREFIGLGLANLIAGLFSGYAVTGGFSRTAVNYQAGGKTPIAAVMTAVLVLMAVTFLTPLFYYLPRSVLAAIIIVAAAGLIDIKGAVHLYRIKKADGWTLAITFLTTLLIGVEQGIIIGVIASLLLFIARSAHPRTAVLGYVEKEKIYRDIRRYPKAATHPDILIIRVDASLYFANARFVENHVREEATARPETQWLIMEMSGVNDIDGVAITTLANLIDELANRGIRVAFAAVKTPVSDTLARAGWNSEQRQVPAYPNLEQALYALT